MYSESLPTTHIVFLLHGLWGNPTQMHTLRDALTTRAKEMRRNVRVWCCESYQRSKTFDGVDVCADRAIHEITEKIEETRKSGSLVQKFSILGYSLGGLIARVVVKHLTSAKSSVLNNVELCNFATFASPAVGIPSTRGPLSKPIQDISAFFLSRSGQHLYLRDRQRGSSKPLVYDLATSEYTDAVKRFKNVDVYVNCVADGLVPYISGAIVKHDPFLPALARARKSGMDAKGDHLTLDNLTLTFDADYPSILTGVHAHSSDEKSEHWEEIMESTVFQGPLEPTTCQKIRPWFLPATYRFLPHPLNYVLVASIPFVVPAIPLVVGAFACQKVASSRRIKKHFREKETNGDENPSGESERTYLNEYPQRKMGEVNCTNTREKEKAAPPPEGSPPTIVDLDDLPRPNAQRALSATQIDIVDMLRSSLGSRMRIHLAFIPSVWNSHAVIMCQNPKIREHLLGKSAVEHWAHHFEF